MKDRRAAVSAWSGILILLAGFQVATLRAADRSPETIDRAVNADAAAASGAETDSPAAAGPGSVATMIEEMRAQIAVQRRQIEKLQSALAQQQSELEKAMRALAANSAPARNTAVTAAPPAQDPLSAEPKIDEVELIKAELEAVAGSAAEANQRLSKLESDTGAYIKSNDAKVRQIGNFSFSGDIRGRWEPFFQEGALDRHRERLRIRLNLTGRLSDEFSGGLSLATGSLDDPISTNQTFTGFLNRKNFGLDRAWITYRPGYAKFMKFDVGKFAYPWYRTPMTFDSDVNPEGFAQTLSFDLKSGALRNITIVGFQLPINEVSSGHDSFILGGQVQTQFRIGSRARLALYGAGININRADPVAVAFAGGALRPSLPNSNTYRHNSGGAVVGYATRFAYLDAIMRLELDTNPRFPTVILFNFVNNVRGSRERSGCWSELTFGRQREHKDVQFGYSFIRIEKDAVIGAWNESDLRSGTNVLNHRLQFAYVLKSNLTAQFTAWIGKLGSPLGNTDLVPPGVRAECTGADVSACRDPYLKRLQFDLLYRF